MRKNHVSVAAVAGLVTLLAMIAMSGTASAGIEGSRVRFALSGAQEEPSNPHGNADRGSVTVFFEDTESDEGTTRVCFKFGELTLTPGESLPTAGHIHLAPAGDAGPIVLHIFGTGDGAPAPTEYPTGKICREAPVELIEAILDNPENYYINLHNPTHPSGVVRGQFPEEF